MAYPILHWTASTRLPSLSSGRASQLVRSSLLPVAIVATGNRARHAQPPVILDAIAK
ncbi:hypothetical protein [Ktedonobacter sp. SOSP1-52]|uniref:hypothetical protein n=1 Tax=Ktedonobacter sp. SOSP1-52 TaxID=2778366 RepID=UPI0019151DEB|nr:hypothetical protein [Ktedonobacter sp. SOSP1-52]